MAKFPAQKVQCPHCAWQGSARGLFTHVRLGHPDKDTSSVRTKGKTFKRSITIDNPHAIGSVTKAIQGKLPERVTDPFQTRDWRLFAKENPIQAAGVKILWGVAIGLAERFAKEDMPVLALSGIPEEEGKKLTTHGVGMKGVRLKKRTK
jgi:hypothetical protein